MQYSPRQYALALNQQLMLDSPEEHAEIADALRSIDRTLRDTSVRAAMQAPGLSHEQRVQVAHAVVSASHKGSAEYAKALASLLALLAEQRKLSLLSTIAAHVDTSDRVTITLADHTMAPATKPLQKKFHEAASEPSFQEQPELIGGFILKKGNDTLDASLRGALETIRIAMNA